MKHLLSSPLRLLPAAGAALSLAMLLACGEPPTVAASASVEGDQVFLAVDTLPGVTVRTFGREVEATSGQLLIEIPLREFPEGNNVLQVEVVDQRGRSAVAETRVYRQPLPTHAFLEVRSCVRGSAEEIELSGDIVRAERCVVRETGQVSLELVGTPRGSLVVDGRTHELDEEGVTRHDLDLRGRLLEAPRAAATGNGLAPISIVQVPYRLDAPDGSHVEGTLSVGAGRYYEAESRRLLTAVAEGTPLPGARAAEDDQGASVITLPTSPDASPRLLGSNGPLAELTYVAVARPAEPEDIGRCGPYLNRSREVTVPHQLVDIDLVLVDAATGGEVDRHTFAARREPCPRDHIASGGTVPPVVDLPSQPAMDRWLRERLE